MGEPTVTAKLTAEVDRDVYERISRGLHHGQMTQLLRAFTLAMDKVIQEGRKGELYLWLYNDEQLILPGPAKKGEGGRE